MSSKRMKQIADTLRRSLAELLIQEVQDPRLGTVRLTHVRVSPDLAQASVYFTLFDPKQAVEVEKALQKAAGFLRSELSRRTVLRRVPKLHFQYDQMIDEGNQLLDIINKAVKADTPSENSPDDESDSTA